MSHFQDSSVELEEEFEEEEEEDWSMEANQFDEEAFLDLNRKKKIPPTIPAIKPSQFTAFAFKMPREDGFGYENFSFEGRRHIIRCYDTPARRILLCCGRQVEKSTLLGNVLLCYLCMVNSYKALYVSPSATQTKVFSVDRIKEPIETSDVLRAFTTNMLSQNIFEKQFVNRSKITLRYAFLNADRTRGIPAWCLALDEIQDILSDNIPVIEQCTSHAPDQFKRFIYAGTPKSLDNTIEYYRANLSTQGEWVVPCDRHGGETGRYWNVLGEKNIENKGLSCEKCHQLINPMHEDAQWAFMTEFHPKNAPFESYRIPQLMVPWTKWDDVLLNYSRYPRDKFYNEVLGISYDSGVRPLTAAQLRECCDSQYDMSPEQLKVYKQMAYGRTVYAGIDWGTGTSAYSVITLGMYIDNKFRVFYMHRFVGEDIEPDAQIQRIKEIIQEFNVGVIGCDWGFGFALNDQLIRAFGRGRVFKYHYMARTRKKVEWDGKLMKFKVHRTEIMSDVFNAIKRGHFIFPKWEVFNQPFAQDMLNIFSEYNETLRMIQYSHSPDKPDDSFHSLVYCLLASMLKEPRPDIIAPDRVDPTKGVILSNYTGPIDQGSV